MYQRNKIADSNLNMNAQVVAVLAMLADREPDFATYKDGDYSFRTQTRGYYNGRERGFCLSCSHAEGPNSDLPVAVINFTVAEHRSCDQIVIREWLSGGFPWETIRGGDWEDMEQEESLAFMPDTMIPYGEIGKAVQHIYKRLEVFWEEHLGITE